MASLIGLGSGRADLIDNAAIIIWDELVNANIAVFEAVHNICSSIKRSQKPFGGIPFIGVGDFRQVAPVIKGAGATATFDACIKSSYLWEKFRVLSLHTPIRSSSDPDFTDFISGRRI